MSAHYSKFDLNTYAVTPYFRAHVPEGYPLDKVLRKGRAFHRLPARLRQLAGLAKDWAMRSYPYPAGIEDIEQWYDSDGQELEPGSGRRLTDDQIDAQWQPDGELTKFAIKDIPLPEGGFADPDTWEPVSAHDANLADRQGTTASALLGSIATRGLLATARAYGVPRDQLARCASDEDLVHLILDMNGQPWPKQTPAAPTAEESRLLSAAIMQAMEQGDQKTAAELGKLASDPWKIYEALQGVRKEPNANKVETHAEEDVQEKDWTCGPRSLVWAAKRLGLSEEESVLADDAGSNPNDGTSPAGLVQAAQLLGLDAEPRHGMSVAALGRECVHGRPVLCCIQSPDAERFCDGPGGKPGPCPGTGKKYSHPSNAADIGTRRNRLMQLVARSAAAARTTAVPRTKAKHEAEAQGHRDELASLQEDSRALGFAEERTEDAGHWGKKRRK